MKFSFHNDFDVPIERLQQAVLRPNLGEELAKRLDSMESVVTESHEVDDTTMHRVLRFQAAAPLSMFQGQPIAKEAMSWREHVSFDLARHEATFHIEVGDRFARYFKSSGTYRLEERGSGSRRIASGELQVFVRLIGGAVERVALREVNKTYDAEAATLRSFLDQAS